MHQYMFSQIPQVCSDKFRIFEKNATSRNQIKIGNLARGFSGKNPLWSAQLGRKNDIRKLYSVTFSSPSDVDVFSNVADYPFLC